MARRNGGNGGEETSVSEQHPAFKNESENGNAGETVELKKELGLMNGVAIIVGVIIGAGIFVSPTGVIEETGSTGLALIVWVLSGLMSMVGALCYAELGTMILKSGADYAYLKEAFGGLPGFMYLWVSLVILVPAGNAILGLTFSQYILQPFWPECTPPDYPTRLLSAIIIALLTAINCYNVKWTARLQDTFTLMKILALVIIVISGIVALSLGSTDNLENPFEGTSKNPGNIALAFYKGLYTYAGWNYLNFVTEEIKDPYKNLPRAIWISLPIVTLCYLSANTAYFVILTKTEMMNSNAVAVTFGDKLLGVMSWIMPVFVACSTFGALNGSIYAPSRLVFVGAREGHLPRALANVNPKTFTPIPALVFLGIMSIIMLVMKDVQILINYSTFVEASFWGFSIAGLLWLRYKRPDLKRPIKVNLILPITFLCVSIFLVTVALYENSGSELGVALIVVGLGIPVYFIFIYWENKPRWMKRLGAFGASKSLGDDEDSPLLANKNPSVIPPLNASEKDDNARTRNNSLTLP